MTTNPTNTHLSTVTNQPTDAPEPTVEARPFDAETMVRCSAYHAHQASHRRVGKGWTCDACNPPTEREATSMTAKSVAP
jgi:hypothetical protein